MPMPPDIFCIVLCKNYLLLNVSSIFPLAHFKIELLALVNHQRQAIGAQPYLALFVVPQHHWHFLVRRITVQTLFRIFFAHLNLQSFGFAQDKPLIPNYFSFNTSLNAPINLSFSTRSPSVARTAFGIPHAAIGRMITPRRKSFSLSAAAGIGKLVSKTKFA